MKALVTLLVLITGVMVSSCQESEAPLEPGETVALNRIPENSAYTSLPLIGTRWKLLGFADEKTGEIRLAEPHSDDNFILIFGDGGKIMGKTSTNEAYGEYSILNDQLLVSTFSNATEINELFDGPLYIETINKVSTFKMSSKGLHLFYDESKFLLFRPTSIIDLCSIQYTSSEAQGQCVGGFLFSMRDLKAEVHFSEALGFYTQFRTEGTYDCSIIGVVCKDNEIRNLVGSTISFSADFHYYGLGYFPPIGGQKVFALNNLTFE